MPHASKQSRTYLCGGTVTDIGMTFAFVFLYYPDVNTLTGYIIQHSRFYFLILKLITGMSAYIKNLDSFFMDLKYLFIVLFASNRIIEY